jgi:Inner membrane component of T3SS, cytoplasmic domain
MTGQLTLTWTESDRVQTKIILGLAIGETAKTFRIGRDPTQCDLVLFDNTVSRVHVEIFFRSDWNHFYLRNLQPKNPPKIDGGILIEGEVALHPESVIELGHLKLAVTDISETKPDRVPVASAIPAPPVFHPLPLSPHPPFRRSTYGLECPHCHRLLPLEMRDSACTHCGHFLADAESIIIPPSG